MNIGDRVYKKSRKPFQNGKRVATIGDFTYLIIAEKGINQPAVVLEGCVGPVAVAILRTDPEGLELMSVRDNATSIKDILEYNSPI